jgi:prophage regulatory protein
MSRTPTLLTKIEVTQRLKVCERTLEKLVRAGQFPQGLKLGKQVMWADEAVENWLSVALASQLSWQPLKTRRSARQS